MSDSSPQESAILKREYVHTMDLSDGDPLVNAPADPQWLMTIEEIAHLMKPLMGIEAPRDHANRILEVRPKGHWFEFEVAKLLGYHYPPRAGLFPDLRHQLLEVKHHTGKEITVDFGRHHPASEEVPDERWNEKARCRIRDIRYLIALAPGPEHRVATMVLASGAEIDSIFGVSPTQTIKYQMGISQRWREEHRGQIIVSGKVFNG